MDLTITVDGRDIETRYNGDVTREGPLGGGTFDSPDDIGRTLRKFTVTVKRDHEGLKDPSDNVTIYRPDRESFDVRVIAMDLHTLPRDAVVQLWTRDERIHGFLAGR